MFLAEYSFYYQSKLFSYVIEENYDIYILEELKQTNFQMVLLQERSNGMT